MKDLATMIGELPGELTTTALRHSSWTEERADSYGRLAFLGDSVLGLAVASEVFERFPRDDIGGLTKTLNHAVSGRACAEVAAELSVPERMRDAEPEDGGGVPAEVLASSERPLASVLEALIGACFVHHGYEPTAAAVVDAFAAQIAYASETLVDFKSALQELLARKGARVSYEVTEEAGPPHDRRFEVRAMVDEEIVGVGSGRSKKEAEQAAAEEALGRLN